MGHSSGNGFKILSNSSGSTVGSALAFTGVLSLLLSLCMDRLSSTSVNERRLATHTARKLSTTLKFSFRKSHLCRQLLVDGRFGQSLAELRSKSDSGELAVGINDIKTSSEGLTVRKGQQFDRFKVESIRFSPDITKVSSASSTYIAELNVALSNLSEKGKVPKMVVVPFYFVTDTSGKLIDCVATSWVNRMDQQTAEDAYCKVVGTGTTGSSAQSKRRYDLGQHRCVSL